MGVMVAYDLGNCEGRAPQSIGHVDVHEHAQVDDEEALAHDFIPAEGLCTALISPHRVVVMGGVIQDERVLAFNHIRHFDIDADSVDGIQGHAWTKAVSLLSKSNPESVSSTGRKRRAATNVNTKNDCIPYCRMEQSSVFVPSNSMIYLIGGLKVGGKEEGKSCRTVFKFDIKKSLWSSVNENVSKRKNSEKDQFGPRFAHSACYLASNGSSSGATGQKKSHRSKAKSNLGYIIAYGGYLDMTGKKPCSSIHVLDIKQEKWTLKPPGTGGMEAPTRAYHAATINKSEKYLIVHGGCQSDFADSLDISSELFVFDLEKSVWKQPLLHPSSQQPPSARKNHCIANGVGKHDGTIILYGGLLANGQSSSDTYLFHLVSGSQGSGLSVIWEKIELTLPKNLSQPAANSSHRNETDANKRPDPKTIYASSGASLIPVPSIEKYVLLGGRKENGMNHCPVLLDPEDDPRLIDPGNYSSSMNETLTPNHVTDEPPQIKSQFELVKQEEKEMKSESMLESAVAVTSLAVANVKKDQAQPNGKEYVMPTQTQMDRAPAPRRPAQSSIQPASDEIEETLQPSSPIVIASDSMNTVQPQEVPRTDSEPINVATDTQSTTEPPVPPEDPADAQDVPPPTDAVYVPIAPPPQTDDCMDGVIENRTGNTDENVENVPVMENKIPEAEATTDKTKSPAKATANLTKQKQKSPERATKSTRSRPASKRLSAQKENTIIFHGMTNDEEDEDEDEGDDGDAVRLPSKRKRNVKAAPLQKKKKQVVSIPDSDMMEVSSDMSRDAAVLSTLPDSPESDDNEPVSTGRRGRGRGRGRGRPRGRGRGGRGRGRGGGTAAAVGTNDDIIDVELESPEVQQQNERKQDVIIQGLKLEVRTLKKEKDKLVESNRDSSEEAKRYLNELTITHSKLANKERMLTELMSNQNESNAKENTSDSKSRIEELQRKWTEAKIQLEAMKAERENMERMMSDLEEDKCELKNKLVEMTSQLSRTCGERDEIRKHGDEDRKARKLIEDNQDELKTKVRRLEEERILLRREVEDKKQEILNMNRERVEGDEELVSAGQSVRNLQSQLSEASKKHENYNSEKRKLEWELLAEKERREEEQRTLEATIVEKRELEERNIQLSAKVNRLEGEIQDRVKECDSTMRSDENLRDQLDSAKSKTAEMTIQVSKLTRELKCSKQRGKKLEQTLNRFKSNYLDMSRAHKLFAKQIDAIESDLATDDDIVTITSTSTEDSAANSSPKKTSAAAVPNNDNDEGVLKIKAPAQNAAVETTPSRNDKEADVTEKEAEKENCGTDERIKEAMIEG